MKNAKPRLLLCAVTLVLWLPFSSKAQSACEGDKCAQPLSKGQRAPFAGQLLSTELAIDLGLKASHCDRRAAIEKEHAKKLAQVEIDLLKELRAIDGEGLEQKQAVVLDELDRANAWYRSPVFVAIISSTATLGLVFASAYALSKVE